MSVHATAPHRPLGRIPAVLTAGVLSLAGCGDSPTQVPDDHVEAAGFAIESEGAELLRYLDSQGGIPELTLEEGTTYELAIIFLDADGDPLEHEDHEAGEEEDELRVTIGNGSVLAWTAEDHGEGEPHEHLEFHGELEALAAGSSTMQVCVLHEDHCDYESPAIAVEVE